VRSIDTARLEEAKSLGDTKASKDGEGLDVSSLCGSTLCVRCRRSAVEREDCELLQSISSKKSLSSRCKQALEALDGGRSREQITEERGVVGWWGRSRS